MNSLDLFEYYLHVVEMRKPLCNFSKYSSDWQLMQASHKPDKSHPIRCFLKIYISILYILKERILCCLTSETLSFWRSMKPIFTNHRRLARPVQHGAHQKDGMIKSLRVNASKVFADVQKKRFLFPWKDEIPREVILTGLRSEFRHFSMWRNVMSESI